MKIASVDRSQDQHQCMALFNYCKCFLRKSRHLPFLFLVIFLAAFGSLSSPVRVWSKVMCAWSAQGAALE